MKKFFYFLAIWNLNIEILSSQDLFSAIYPIGDLPNIGYKTTMVPEYEQIIFEANPILRMPLYNKIQRRLQNGKKHASAAYLSFKPQLRMFADNSKPVKTPSYRISVLGFQHLIILPQLNISQSLRYQSLAFSLESGHYSNGQFGCTFHKNHSDGSQECNNEYTLINDHSNLTELLNRETGNFSTNYTEFISSYRLYLKTDDNIKPTSQLVLNVGLQVNHDNLLFLFDVGGYSDQDLQIMGRSKVLGELEFINSIPFWKKRFDRYSLKYNTEYITKIHPWIKPFRFEFTGTIFLKNNLGFFISLIKGHDNYNFRLVDSGTQFFTGIKFDIFPPIEITN